VELCSEGPDRDFPLLLEKLRSTPELGTESGRTRGSDSISVKERFTIVIPTKNRKDDLIKCLRSLDQQSWKNFEVLVIDNQSTDGTREAVRNFEVKLLTDSSDNIARLFNIGWRRANTNIIAYLNDDTEVVQQWAETLHKYLSEESGVKALGGPAIATHPQRMYRVYEQSPHSSLLRFVFGLYDKVVMKGKFLKIGEFTEWGGSSIGGSLYESTELDQPLFVNGLTGTNLAIRREILEELGGFDEAFQYVHADGDLFLRMRKRGYKMVFHPKMILFHHVNQRGNTRSYYFLGRDFSLLWLKHSRTMEAGLLSFLHALFMTAYVIIYTSKSIRAFQLKSWLQGLSAGVRYYLINRKAMLF